MFNLIKTSIFGAIFFNFGLDPHISEPLTDSFRTFGADRFVYLTHTGI